MKVSNIAVAALSALPFALARPDGDDLVPIATKTQTIYSRRPYASATTITVHAVHEEGANSAYAYETQSPSSSAASHEQVETLLSTEIREQSTMVNQVVQVTVPEAAAETTYSTKIITRPRHHHHKTKTIIEGSAVNEGAPTGPAAVLPAAQSIESATSTTTEVVTPGEYVAGNAVAGATTTEVRHMASTTVFEEEHVPSATRWENVYDEDAIIAAGRPKHHKHSTTSVLEWENFASPIAYDESVAGVSSVEGTLEPATVTAIETIAANTDGQITTKFATIVLSGDSTAAPSFRVPGVGRFQESVSEDAVTESSTDSVESDAPEATTSIMTQVIVFNTSQPVSNQTAPANTSASATVASGFGPFLNTSTTDAAATETSVDTTVVVIATGATPSSSAASDSMVIVAQPTANAPFANSTTQSLAMAEATSTAATENSTVVVIVPQNTTSSSQPTETVFVTLNNTSSTAVAPFANDTSTEQAKPQGTGLTPSANTTAEATPAVNSSAPAVPTEVPPFANSTSAEPAAPQGTGLMSSANTTAEATPAVNSSTPAMTTEVPPFANSTSAQPAAPQGTAMVPSQNNTVDAGPAVNSTTPSTPTAVAPFANSTSTEPAAPQGTAVLPSQNNTVAAVPGVNTSAPAASSAPVAPFANSTTTEPAAPQGTAPLPSQNTVAVDPTNDSSSAANTTAASTPSNGIGSSVAPFANSTSAQPTMTASNIVLPAQNTSNVMSPAMNTSAPAITETVLSTLTEEPVTRTVVVMQAQNTSRVIYPTHPANASRPAVTETVYSTIVSVAPAPSAPQNSAPYANQTVTVHDSASASNTTITMQQTAVTTVHDVIDTTHTLTITEKCSSCSDGHTVYTSTSVCPLTTSTNVYPAPPPPTHATMTYGVSSASSTWSASSVETVTPTMATYAATFTTETSYSTSTSVCTEEPEPVTHTFVETICQTFTIPASSAWEYPKTESVHKRNAGQYSVNATSVSSEVAPSLTVSTIWATSCSTTVICPSSKHDCEQPTTSTHTHMIPYTTTTCEETSSTAPPKTYAPPPTTQVESSTSCTSSTPETSSTKSWHNTTTTPCTTSTPAYVHYNTTTPQDTTISEHQKTTIPVYPVHSSTESVSEHPYPTYPPYVNKTQPIVPGPTQAMTAPPMQPTAPGPVQPGIPQSQQPPYVNSSEPITTQTTHVTSSSTFYQETTLYMTKSSQPAVPSICVPIQQISDGQVQNHGGPCPPGQTLVPASASPASPNTPNIPSGPEETPSAPAIPGPQQPGQPSGENPPSQPPNAEPSSPASGSSAGSEVPKESSSPVLPSGIPEVSQQAPPAEGYQSNDGDKKSYSPFAILPLAFAVFLL